MSSRPSLGTQGPGSAFVVGLLLLTVVLTGILGFQALSATRSHERVAEKTAKEHASFAAWEYTGIARQTLEVKLLKPGLEMVAQAGGKYADKPFEMVTLEALAAKKTWHYAGYVDAYFRLDLSAGAATVLGSPPADLARWIEAELPTHIASVYGDGYGPVMVFPPGSSASLVYRLYPEDRAEALTAYGYLIRREGLEVPLGYAFDDNALLPEPLTGEVVNHDLFSVRVEAPDGAMVYASEPTYDSPFSVRDTLGVAWGGMVARVTIRPEAAETLVIGGFPRSRLPLVLGLLALTVGLVLAAILQLRREAQLALLRADFVSGVSHELRTPLAQIRMFAETLLLGRVRSDEERQRSLEIIVNESRRLTHQVDNVLLFSRSERQAMRLNPEPTDLGDALADVVETFTPLAQAARCALDAHLVEGTVARVDGAALRQAVLNLLDNAVKYGPAGQTIQVGVSRLPGNRALLWVEDQGPGVAEEDRATIWEPYSRLESHRESAVAGSGIGLAVVRQIVHQHGGSVRAEAADGGGARFVMELPCMPAAGASPGGPEEGTPAPQATPRAPDRVPTRAPAPTHLREATE